MEIKISKTCCLCYGAKRALDCAVHEAKTRKNVVLFKELLHNQTTVSLLKSLGVKQKESLDEFKSDDFVILRAHGEPKFTYKTLKEKNINFVDCTCPNVMAINKLVEKKDLEGYKIILVGKYGYKSNVMHPEVKGTSGWCNNPIFIEEVEEVKNIDLSFEKYFLVVQTTFSNQKAEQIISLLSKIMNDNKKIFEFKNTTCNAQRKINEDSINLAKEVDVMLVIGGKNSSNTKELFNNVSSYIQAYFVQNLQEVKELIKNKKFLNCFSIGLTAGASTTMEELLEIKNFLTKNL